MRWQLDEIHVSELRQLASDLLDRGESARGLIELLVLEENAPAAARTEAFERALRELGAPDLNADDPMKFTVDETARQIVVGAIPPYWGAERLSRCARLDDQLWQQLVVFVALEYEYTERNRPWNVLDAEIVAAAKRILDSRGLRSPAPPDLPPRDVAPEAGSDRPSVLVRVRSAFRRGRRAEPR